MKIYVISVFLNEENLKNTLHLCEQKGYKIKQSVEQDQTGESATVYCTEIKKIRFVFVGCNDFHQDHDFEIGLTPESRESAVSFFNSLDKQKYEAGVFSQDFMYAIPLDEEYHGPFFFNYDNGLSSETDDLKCIKATISEHDYNLYNNEIKSLLDKELSDKIVFTPGDHFYLNDISFF